MLSITATLVNTEQQMRGQNCPETNTHLASEVQQAAVIVVKGHHDTRALIEFLDKHRLGQVAKIPALELTLGLASKASCDHLIAIAKEEYLGCLGTFVCTPFLRSSDTNTERSTSPPKAIQ